MRVSVIGTGYVGLVSALCLASRGHTVTCVDVDARKIESIALGIAPFYERGLQELIAQHVGRAVSATTDLEAAVRQSDLSMLAVGTPFDGHHVDLTQVKAAAVAVGEALRGRETYHVVAVKSTVVPGTTDEVVGPLLEIGSGKKVGRDFGLAMNPEFLREGEAIHDFMNPDRIVIGGVDDRTIDTVAQLYETFDADVIRTNNRTAEMTKYATNALLATLISFSNEVGNLCASVGDIDIIDVMKGVHLDRRLSPVVNGERVSPGVLSYLAAGCGFGGSCFPKDVKAIVAQGRGMNLPMRLLTAVIDVNREQPMQVIAALENQGASLAGMRVAVLGLAFKAGTDDMRESAAIPVIEALLARAARVKVYDPVAVEAGRAILGLDAVTYCDTLEQCIDGARAVVILTAWEEFKCVPALITALPDPPIVIDGRRLIDRSAVPHYAGIGFRHRTPTTASASSRAATPTVVPTGAAAPPPTDRR